MSSANLTNNLKKLKYKIISCSSQQSQYPVSSLLFGSGCWQTKRFCTYPQEITFQFYGPVSISKIQLISDNRKIPSQVDILYYSPNSISSQRFIKYGFLNFNKNQNSQLKQQKSLMVDIKCLYLRFLFHKPYNSKENFFSQISIHSIQIYGTDAGIMAVMEKGTRQNANIGSAYNHINNNINNNLNNYQQDSYIIQKLSYLTQLKQKAVSEQDFQQANFLKTMIQQVRQLGEQLKKLQIQKHQAIQLEDYQKANHLKKSIDKHKKQIDALIEFQDDDQVIQNQTNNHNHNINFDTNNNQNDFQDNQFVDPEMNQMIRNSSTFNNNNKNTNNKSNLSNNNLNNNNNTNNSRVISNSRVKLNRSLIKNNKQFSQNYDQRVIPTLSNNNKQKTQILQQQNLQQQQQRPELHAQQLDGKYIQFSLILQQHFQQQLIKCFFSSYWQLKVQALNQILQQIKSKQNDNNKSKIDSTFIKSLIVVVKNSINQMNFQVALNSLLVLEELLRLNRKGNYLNRSNQLNNDLDGIGKQIVKRLSDNNNKIKLQAQKIFTQMISSSLYGPQISSILLTKTKQKSTKLSSKQIITRLIQLQKIVQSHPITNIIIQSSLDYGIQHCKNPSLQVRNQAISLLISCKNKNQQEVEKKLKQQKNVLEMIETAQNKSKGQNQKKKRKK